MKILLPIFLLALSHFPLQKEDLPDRVREGLAGAVKSVRWYRADFTQDDGPWIEGDKKYSHEVKYDENGNRAERQERYPYYYYCYNEVDIETTYDHRGYRVDTLTFNRKRDGSPNGKEINTYDDKDQIVESVRQLDDGRIAFRTVYTCNEKGHTVEVNYYKFGKYIQKYTSTYEYDSTGNWVKETYTRWMSDSGILSSYPVAVFYREISYY